MLEMTELNDLRQRVLKGEQLPPETYRQIIDSLRTRREQDIAAAGERKAKAEAKQSKVTSDEDLNKILGF